MLGRSCSTDGALPVRQVDEQREDGRQNGNRGVGLLEQVHGYLLVRAQRVTRRIPYTRCTTSRARRSMRHEWSEVLHRILDGRPLDEPLEPCVGKHAEPVARATDLPGDGGVGVGVASQLHDALE